MKEAGLPLEILVAHGRSMMRWRLDNQDGFADSPYKQCGGSKTLMWSIDSVWTWIWLEEESMPYRFGGSQKWNVSVWYPFDTSIGLKQAVEHRSLYTGEQSIWLCRPFVQIMLGERRVEVVDGFGPGDLVR
jgi:hypothetical protein